VQGASTSVAYSWTADKVPAEAAPRPSVPPAPAASPVALRVTLARVRRTIQHHRLLVWARGNAVCAIGVRGRLRVSGGGGHRAAKLHGSGRRRFSAGPRRLSIPIPRRLRSRLEAGGGEVRARARIVLAARGHSGERAIARRTVRLWPARRWRAAGRR
jgi:hypothetical protein